MASAINNTREEKEACCILKSAFSRLKKKIHTNRDLLLCVIVSGDTSVFIEHIPVPMTWMASLKTWLGFVS